MFFVRDVTCPTDSFQIRTKTNDLHVQYEHFYHPGLRRRPRYELRLRSSSFNEHGSGSVRFYTL